jgi:hypothetical protein
MSEEKFSFFDWVGFVIGIVVIGFILCILIWPIIDPTPNRSASIQENLEKLSGKSKQE